MPLTWTHPFASAVADGADATLVRPSNWNAAHTVAGAVAGALIFASSIATLDNAAGTTWDNTARSLTLDLLATNTFKIGRMDATYNGITFNGNLATFGSSMCIEGGGGTDLNMYFNVPTGGTLEYMIGGGARLTVAASSIHPAGNTTTIGDAAAGHRFPQAFLGGQTVTASTPVIDITQTWNNAAVAFTGLKFNITDTASAAATSLLMDLQVGGVSKFSVGRDAFANYQITAGAGVLGTGNGSYCALGISSGWALGAAAATLIVPSDGVLGWSSVAHTGNFFNAPDTNLYRDAAGILAQRNGVNAQGFRVYNTADTFPTTTNYERGVFDWTTTANTLTIGTQAGGTGAARNVALVRGAITDAQLGGTGMQVQKLRIYQTINGTQNAEINGSDGGANGTIFYLGSSSVIKWGTTGLDYANDVGMSRATTNTLDINTGTAGSVAYVRLNGVAVASLPVASATYKGCRGTVTDANATTFMTTVAGGGTNVVPVFCDGTAWKIG